MYATVDMMMFSERSLHLVKSKAVTLKFSFMGKSSGERSLCSRFLFNMTGCTVCLIHFREKQKIGTIE